MVFLTTTPASQGPAVDDDSRCVGTVVSCFSEASTLIAPGAEHAVGSLNMLTRLDMPDGSGREGVSIDEYAKNAGGYKWR